MYTPLEVIELSKAYNTKEAVKNVSFKINKNEIIGILGPNGCGKTTTIGMILGLLKPSKGKVLINGLEIETKRVEILNNLNFISPYIELPKKLTVKQNLEVYGRLYDVKNLNTKIWRKRNKIGSDFERNFWKSNRKKREKRKKIIVKTPVN